MMSLMGARNARGFSSAVNSGYLPPPTHLSYEGVFNELKFDVGPKTQKLVDLHLGYGRYQFQKSNYDPKINDYLALFIKSQRDGAQRDARPMNATILLDISGSMNGRLSYKQQEVKSQSRLKLSVQAIKMLISKLRPNDSIGLIVFDDKADVVIPQICKSQINETEVFNDLDKIVVRGGTTISVGFKLAEKVLRDFLEKNKVVSAENRIILLTDVCDNSISTQKQFITEVQDSLGVSLTIIGISQDFRSQTCQTLKNVKGFNYFCAVDNDDIKKYVFQTFDFGFFPAANDLHIDIECDQVESFEVFGSPDSDQVNIYNDDFKNQAKLRTVSKLKTLFPSQIEIIDGKVFTVGGLILLKLKRKPAQINNNSFKGKLLISYSDLDHSKLKDEYAFEYEFYPHEQFWSDESLRQALEGFIFVSQLKNILRQWNVNHQKNSQLCEKYSQMLINLQKIAPESKKKELTSFIKIINDTHTNLKKEKQKTLQ